VLKIEKIGQVKSLLKVTFDNGSSLLFLPDIVYGRSLKEGNSYEESVINALIAQNDESLCFQSLLKILKTRMHSTGELRRKLAAKKFNFSLIEHAIQKALETGVTRDENAAECYKNELSAKGYGSFRIRDAMRRKGFSEDIIDNFITTDTSASDEENENAKRIFEKKLASLKKDKSLLKHKLREKLFRFMQSKGYSSETILSLIKDFSD